MGPIRPVRVGPIVVSGPDAPEGVANRAVLA